VIEHGLMKELNSPTPDPAIASLLTSLSVLEDPRDPRGKLHTLSDVLAIIVLATLCSCENGEEFEEWAHKEESWLRSQLPLRNGIPSQDTYLRVLAALDPVQFRAVFLEWVKQVFAPLGLSGQLAIDGKTLRGSRNAATETVHMVSALLCDSGLVVAQAKTEEKSNEIVAIPELLRLLSLQGTLISMDAMGCQRDIAQQIVEQGGDYLLQVKGNQPTLSHEIQTLFRDALAETEHAPLDRGPAPRVQQHEHTDGGHGRIETRKTVVCSDLPESLTSLGPWSNLRSLVMVEATRTNTTTDAMSIEQHYYISSRLLSAEEAGRAVRAHWLIENQLHWVLDMTFGEDACRVRTEHAAHNFALIRHFVFNLLRRVNDKHSMRRRRRLCDWHRDYREKVIRGQL
jgi:predicted transposase YbfD/YdcC